MGKKRIGVLALQGDVEKHAAALQRSGADTTLVRRPEDLAGIDGIVIPGGESTTIGKLLVRFGLLEKIGTLIKEGLPAFGTCAGLILLAKEISGYDQPGFGLLDVSVERNAYGRQVMSFESDVSIPALGKDPLRAVFIRAPIITRTGEGVETLASFEGTPVFVRQANILAASFHPELTDDSRIHSYFLGM